SRAHLQPGQDLPHHAFLRGVESEGARIRQGAALVGDLEALAPQLGDALRFHDPIAVDGVPVHATIEPRDDDDLAAVLVALGELRCAATPLGAAPQLGFGNAPQRADCFLSLAAFARIDELDASEGVCHAGAGTPLAELRARAHEAGWELPIDDAGRGGTLGG